MRKQPERNIRLLGWFNFLLDFRLYAPIMIIYFERITGSYVLAMSILAVVMLSAALLELSTGIFSDMMGRRRTVIAGAAASLGAVTCYALGGSYWVLLIGALCEGLERSLFSGNNNALLYDTLTELNEVDEYQNHLGRVSSAFQLALGISAVLGGLFAAISFPLVMWLSVVPKVIMLGLSFGFVEPRIHSEVPGSILAHLGEALRVFAANRKLRLLGAAQILAMGANEAAFQFRVVFIEMLWPLWAIGVARAISNAAAAVSFFFAGDLLKRFGERRLLVAGISLSETMNTIALVWASVFSPVLMGATSLFYGVNEVSKNGMLQREFTDAQRSTMGSMTAFGGSICFAVLALGLGWLADQIGVRYALIIITLLGATRLLLFWMAFQVESSGECVGASTD